jgi:hypothetical protein
MIFQAPGRADAYFSGAADEGRLVFGGETGSTDRLEVGSSSVTPFASLGEKVAAVDITKVNGRYLVATTNGIKVVMP